jgi:hypothetical protein
MAKRISKALATVAALSLGSGVWASQAQAVVVFLGSFSGTECGGQGGFSNCYAYQTGTAQGQTGGGSPSIFKYNFGGATDKSTLFSSITGSEFNIDYLANTNTLSFVYTPGANDPEVHYVAVKQANGFALFYDASAITSGSIALNDYFPRNPGYSHITFFDTGSTGAVPEPATWAMMLLGFGLVGNAAPTNAECERPFELLNRPAPNG